MQIKDERDLLLGTVVGLLTTAVIIKFGGVRALRKAKTTFKNRWKTKNHGLKLIKKVQK